jgi:hypothetical protein
MEVAAMDPLGLEEKVVEGKTEQRLDFGNG